MYLQKVPVISKTTKKKNLFFVASWRLLTKGAGSGHVSQSYGFADPDPYQMSRIRNTVGCPKYAPRIDDCWSQRTSQTGPRRECGCWVAASSAQMLFCCWRCWRLIAAVAAALAADAVAAAVAARYASAAGAARAAADVVAAGEQLRHGEFLGRVAPVWKSCPPVGSGQLCPKNRTVDNI